MALLQKQIEAAPDDLRTLWHYLNSAQGEPDYYFRLEHALSLLEAHCQDWETLGPGICSTGISAAYRSKLPELEKWISRAKTLFPNSYRISLDVGFIECIHAWDNADYGKTADCAKSYLDALLNYQTDPAARFERIYGGCRWAGERSRNLIESLRAESQRKLAASDTDRELMQLAAKVRAILSSLPPDSPDVAALKASPVYQKLKHIIEGDNQA